MVVSWKGLLFASISLRFEHCCHVLKCRYQMIKAMGSELMIVWPILEHSNAGKCDLYEKSIQQWVMEGVTLNRYCYTIEAYLPKLNQFVERMKPISFMTMKWKKPGSSNMESVLFDWVVAPNHFAWILFSLQRDIASIPKILLSYGFFI